MKIGEDGRRIPELEHFAAREATNRLLTFPFVPSVLAVLNPSLTKDDTDHSSRKTKPPVSSLRSWRAEGFAGILDQ